MQSGSDAVLRRMRRRWGAQRFIDRCALVSEQLDRPALTTDIIVGFPGENDADFEATCRVAETVGFSKIHIFPFSPRRGTPAAEFTDAVPDTVRRERCQHLARVEVELRERYFHGLLNKPCRVLIESIDEEQPRQGLGTSCRYAPVQVNDLVFPPGQFVEVLAERVDSGRLVGRAI